jgi:galactokinase
MAARLPGPLDRRVRHVVTANDRVDRAVEALRSRSFEQLGRLLDASQASLRDDYEVSTPAVDAAVGRLKDAGALGARLVGGGFGGHVLGLLAPGATAPPGAFRVRSGGGARVVAG